MRKEIINLLTVSTVTPISISSSDGALVLSPITFNNDHCRSGILYLEASGFSTPTTGLYAELYHSHRQKTWFLCTAVPAFTTAKAVAIAIPYLGLNVGFGYGLDGQRVTKFRATLEVFCDD